MKSLAGKRYMLWLGGFALLIMVAVWQSQQRESAPATPIACMDISSGCASADGRVRLRFDRQPKTMVPFGLKVSAAATKVYASFAMPGMEMGLNRYRLLPQDDGFWSAKITLPVCANGRNDWTMMLEVVTPDETVRYTLAFGSA
jgi:hypothetical protein